MTKPTTGTPPEAPPTSGGDDQPANGRGIRAGVILALLTTGWLTARLWAAYRQIYDGAGGSVAAAALSLPAAVQSTMLAGLGCGLAARTTSSRSRWLVAPLAGLVVGGLALAAILTAYGDAASTVRVALTVAAAGLVGGVIAAAPRDTAIVAAGATAAFGASVLDTVLNSGGVLDNMMSAFGGRASATPAAIVSASSAVAHIDSVVVGLAAGLLAYWYLHRRGGLRFPAYQIAGALTGILLVVSEGLVATGGAGLLHAAASISPAYKTALDLLDSARIINGLLVLFIGVLTAMIAFGRTLGPRLAPGPDRPAQRSS